MKRIICALLCLAMLPILPICGEGAVKVYGGQDNSQMKIALSFDDGPHPRNTERILDILAEYGIKATFFVVGENVEYYSAAAIRAVREGHEIGNHTYTHPHIAKLDRVSLDLEVARCQETVKRVLGYDMRLFRPPEGVVDDAVKVMAGEQDYSVILWRIDTRDWARTSSSDICANVSKNIRSGDIILMHDYFSKGCHTVEALEKMIPMLLERGYNFVTVGELIGIEK